MLFWHNENNTREFISTIALKKLNLSEQKVTEDGDSKTSDIFIFSTGCNDYPGLLHSDVFVL